MSHRKYKTNLMVARYGFGIGMLMICLAIVMSKG
ncbi:hypothetical protein PBI_CAMILLE_81 [Microbacterium phage Camille]|nr:hypothetical protein PBI_CAMILLE_81 [Microbacterium phage Camille]